MKISGTAVLNAPVDQVWAAFNDPAVLARTIPGCQELHEVGPDAYRMTVTAGVASIKGTYEGNVSLTERNPPGFFVLRAAGAGAPGTVGADVKISLLDSATGGTDLSYDADAVVGGVIGGVGLLFPVFIMVALVRIAMNDMVVFKTIWQIETLLYTLAGAAIALAGVAVGIVAGRG